MDLLSDREFQFTDRDFRFIQDLVKAEAGIHLTEAKRELVYGRIVRRVRALDQPSFKAYLEALGDTPDELRQFINAITTNLTFFFRQPDQFQHLKERLIPRLRARGVSGPLKLWSTACSTGQEPYTLAITAREAEPRGPEAKILATDLDTDVLATARAGVYPIGALDPMTEAQRKRWFKKGSGARADQVKVSRELQSLIRFGQLNLMGDWPMRGPFHVIFCRNVVIYFDQPTKARLFDRLADLLHPEGALYLGYSESLVSEGNRFQSIGKGIYQVRS